MYIDVENVFNSIFWVAIFRKLCDVGGPLANIVPFIKLFYCTHYFLYYQHGQHVEGVTIIESSLNMRQGDPLGGPLFTFAHYQAFLNTIVWASNSDFPILMDNTHIMEPLSETTHTFNHFST